MSKTFIGICFGVIASVSIAAMGIFVKFISDDVNNLTIVCFRFAISLIILLPFFYKNKSCSLKIKFPFLLAIRIISGILAVTTYFYAIHHIVLADAILLQSTYPIFVPIVIFSFTGQKTSLKVLLGIIISFIGIILVVHPGGDIFQSYSLVALSSAVFVAISFFFLRIMLKKDETQAENLLFYFFLFGCLALVPYVIMHWRPLTLSEWLCLLAIGVFGYGYQYFQTKALQLASVRIISPLTYIAVIVGGLFDRFIWHISISYIAMLGVAITITGAIFVILNKDKAIL